jgi:hypothetical protein
VKQMDGAGIEVGVVLFLVARRRSRPVNVNARALAAVDQPDLSVLLSRESDSRLSQKRSFVDIRLPRDFPGCKVWVPLLAQSATASTDTFPGNATPGSSMPLCMESGTAGNS